ncbi:MAG: GAF domain-containing protein [Chloroflexota bacterium]
MLLSTAFGLYAMLYAFSNHRSPGATAFGWVMLDIAAWTFAYIFELTSPNPSAQIFWMQLRFSAAAFLAPLFVRFAWEFTGAAGPVQRSRIRLLTIVPLAAVLLTWLYGTGWLWEITAPVQLGSLTLLTRQFQPAGTAYAIYNYLLLAVGVLQLYRVLARSAGKYRMRGPALVLAITSAVVGHLISVLNPTNLPPLDWTSYALFLSGAITLWGINRFHFLEILPRARQITIETLQDGLLVLDLQDEIVYANPAAGKLLAQPVEELVGRPVHAAVPNWSSPQPGQSIPVEPAGWASQPGGYSRLMVQGEGAQRRWYDLNVMQLSEPSGVAIGKLVSWHDVTESQQFVENSPNPIFAVDQQGQIQSWNQSCTIIFQYPLEQALGMDYRSIIYSPATAELDDCLAQVFRLNRAVSEIELVFRCQDGSTRSTASRLFPAIGRSGKVERCVFANTNITGRKRSEQALQKQLQELSVLHSVATLSVEADNEDALIAAAIQVIGSTLEADNYGVLTINEKTDMLVKHPSYRENLPAPVSIPLGVGVSSRVIREGRPLRFADIRQEASYFEIDSQTRSELCVPLRAGSRIIGVINLESHRIAAYSPEDERLLVTIAGQLSTAMERLRSAQSARQRIQELLAISRISQEITSVLDRQQVLNSIVRYAAQIANAGASGLFLRQGDNRLYLVATYGVGERFVSQANLGGIPLDGESAIARAASSGRPMQYADLNEVSNSLVQDLSNLEGFRAVLAAPMLRGIDPVGGIVIWQRQPYRFSAEEEMFLQALAHQCVNAVENARLFEVERSRRQIAEVMRDTGSVLSATLNMDNLLDILLIQVERLVPYDAANFTFLANGVGRVARSRGYEKFSAEFAALVNALVLPLSSTPNLRRMVESRQPYLISDTTIDSEWLHISPENYVRSWIGAPVLQQDEVVAFFSLDSSRPNFYQPEHAESLSVLAGQASLALQNAILFDETRRRLREVTLLSRVIAAGTSSLDLPPALAQVCEEVSEYFDTRAVAFGLQQPGDGAWQVIALEQPEQPGSGCTRPDLASGALPARLHGPEAQRRFQELQLPFSAEQAASAVLAPLTAGGRPCGLFAVGLPSERAFSASENDLVQDIARQVSQALERHTLFTDARRQAERMAQLAELSEKLNQPLSVGEVIVGIGQGAMTLGQANRGAVYLRIPGEAAECGWFQGISQGYIERVLEQISHVPGGQLLNHTEPIYIHDIFELPETAALRRAAAGEAFRSIGLWPLVYQGHVIAAVGLYYDQPCDWPPMLSEILLAFTRQAAIALQNARLFEETRRRTARQESLNHIITAAVSAADLKTLMETLIDLSLAAFGVEIGWIWIGSQVVVRGAALQQSSAEFIHLHTRSRRIPTTLVINDWAQLAPNDRLAAIRAEMQLMQVNASLSVPLLSNSRMAGELALGSRSRREWSAEEIALAEMIGRQIGSAVERLQLLAKTQQQAQQMQQIMDTVPEGVALLGPDQRVVLANPAAAALLPRLAPQYDPGRPLEQLADRPVQALLSASPGHTWEELNIPGSPPSIFELAARPLETGDSPGGWVLVLRDVTNERNNLARVQMQERLATVGQLAAGIAHDFNNIMAAVVVYADLLLLQPGLSSSAREHVQIIQQQVQRATGLIRQILDFSRRSVLEPSPLDVLPFLKEFEKLIKRVLPEDIHVRLTYQPGSYRIKADPVRLQQILMNLALNARDAMPQGGALQITLDRLELAVDSLRPMPDMGPGSWVRLALSDTGLGIEAENLPYIFDPFFTTKPVGKGTGLGLAQVYGIIKQHGGSIDVKSEYGAGATFTIYLPELENDPRERVQAAASRALPQLDKTVLLVEDDQPARTALASLLQRQGLTVVTAADGLQALQIFNERSGEIDLVISDIVMPEMGGLKLHREIQQQHPGMKFLFITGHPLDAEEQELLEAGQVQRLLKPFTARELTNALWELLRAA